MAAADNPLRAARGFGREDFVVAYSGNLGRAHDIAVLLGAAEALKGTPQIRSLFIGAGHHRAERDAEAAKRSLTSIITRPCQPREQLGLSHRVPGVHRASLLPPLEGLILPSELYRIAAAGRPRLMVGKPDGDTGRIIHTHGFGATAALTAQIQAWKAAPEEILQMGARARAYIKTLPIPRACPQPLD